jgi:hypothetical protein
MTCAELSGESPLELGFEIGPKVPISRFELVASASYRLNVTRQLRLA